MTTPAAQQEATALLQKACAATTSPAFREVLTTLLEGGAADLFEVHHFASEDLVFAFAAPPAFWIIGSGQVYVERRSSQGRGLRPRCVKPGNVLGTVPTAHTRAWPPQVDAYVRAITAVDAVALPQDRFAQLLRRFPKLAPLLSFVDLRERVGEVVELQLRAVPGLLLAPTETLTHLLDRAERMELHAGQVLLQQGDVADRFFVMLEGTVTARRTHDDGEVMEHTAGAGQLVGLPSLVGAMPALETCIADGHGVCAVVTQEMWRAMLAAHPQCRRGVQTLLPADTFDLVLVQSDVPNAPLAEATTLLARSLREEFGDDTVIVHLVRPGLPAAPAHDLHGTPLLTVRAEGELDAPAAINAALCARAGRGHRADVVFLHPDPAWTAAAAPVVSRVAWLTTTAGSVPQGPLRRTRIDRAGLLAPLGHPVTEPWPTSTVRLRLDFAQLRRRAADPRPLMSGPDAETPTIQGVRRWGRAITERLVGLAFGGGGSPGFAHIALIRALEKRARLPIDMIAGTSFGALVGAWYVGVRQLELQEPARLQTMLDAGRQLNARLMVGMVDTTPLARFIDRTFKNLRLAELERPFFPVSAEVDSGTVYVGRGTSLGGAVQMSGAFPPFFPPVIRPGNARLVDGGFVNNVPASVLRTEGASFVIASNSIGLIPPRPVVQEASHLRRVLSALNPVGRFEDATRAGLMLFHRIGDAQSLFADAAFESAFTGIAFWDFNRGQEVIDQVQADADAFADRVALGIAMNGKKGNVRAFGSLA